MTNSGRVKHQEGARGSVWRIVRRTEHVWHRFEELILGVGRKLVVADQTRRRRADRDHEQRCGDFDELSASATHTIDRVEEMVSHNLFFVFFFVHEL